MGLVTLRLYATASSPTRANVSLLMEGGPGQAVDNIDVAALMERLVVLVRKQSVDADLDDWLLPALSTTLLRNPSTAAAVFLGTIKQECSYSMEITCGFPFVTLLAERSDWAYLARRFCLSDKISSLIFDTIPNM